MITTNKVNEAAIFCGLQQDVKTASIEDVSQIISKIVKSSLGRFEEIALLKGLKKATDIGLIELKRELKNQQEQQKQEASTGYKKMPVSFFNDTKFLDFGELPLETIANVGSLMEYYGISARYNQIKKKEEITIPSASFSPDNKDNCALGIINSLAKLNQIPTSNVKNFVDNIANQNEYNPVTEWIDSSEWDGKDRLEELFNTLILKEDFPIELRNLLLTKWLISAVAAVYSPDEFRCRGVLTLQGPQSIGKTAWLLSLIDDKKLKSELIKTDHLLDVSNKDSILIAIAHWLVELGELETSFKKDIGRLKGFLTAGADIVRRPYAYKESEYQRRTVFFASVNDSEFLVDTTGNTRWWTLPVIEVKTDHNINMQQLWAQVKDLYEKGEKWWLSREEELWLESFNKQHEVVNAVKDAVITHFSLIVNPTEWRSKSASEVLKLIGYQQPTGHQAKDCGSALRELYGEPTTKSQGVNKWRVPIKSFASN